LSKVELSFDEIEVLTRIWANTTPASQVVVFKCSGLNQLATKFNFETVLAVMQGMASVFTLVLSSTGPGKT
jgi:hypothetical protein